MDDPMEQEVVHSKTSGRENVTRPPPRVPHHFKKLEVQNDAMCRVIE
jgi:hypothetical protein